jgi:hypothetical protein
VIPEGGVFVGIGARIASFGARSWRTFTGVAGVVGEGARRYGHQVTQASWICGNVGPVQVSFGSYQQAGGPLSMPQARASLPDVAPESLSGPAAASADFVALAASSPELSS